MMTMTQPMVPIGRPSPAGPKGGWPRQQEPHRRCRLRARSTNRCGVRSCVTQSDVVREDLASLLHLLPAGEHVMVYAPLAQDDILRACKLAAEDADEQWLVHGVAPGELPPDVAPAAGVFPHFGPDTFVRQLDAAQAAARKRGKQGVLLTIFPASRMEELGRESHLAAEGRLGPRAPTSARVVCIYTPRAEGAMAPKLPEAESSHSLVYTLLGAP
jgi:hypothetical protein